MISNFIRAIAEKKSAPEVHRAFVRYSVGDFTKEDFVIQFGKKIVIKAAFEWVNFVHVFFAKLAQDTLEIKGAIESLHDRSSVFESLGILFTSDRRRMKSGLQFQLKPQTVSAETYRELLELCQIDYLLFSVKSPQGELKISAKTTPKVNKPTPGFLTLTLSKDSLDLVKKEYLFDAPGSFKKAIIKHIYHVESIEVDEKLLGSDPARARREALRKGTIERAVVFDDTPAVQKMYPFCV